MTTATPRTPDPLGFLRGVSVSEAAATAAKVTAIDRRYLTLDVGGQTLSVADVAARLDKLSAQPEETWQEDEARLFAAFYAMGQAHIRLEQVGITADLEVVERHLRRMHLEYRTRLEELGEDGGPPTDSLEWWEVAARLPVLRRSIDRTFMRVLEIDGRTWHRRELLLPLEQLHGDVLPPALAAALAERHPAVAVPSSGDVHACLREATLAEIDAHETPMALIELIMAHAAEDPRHPSDHATLMCPRGTNLDRPGRLGKEDFGIYVVFHRDFVPQPGSGVGDHTAIRKAMYAHHAAKKARVAKKIYDADDRYTPAGLADDLGARGIFFNENAHHRGHVVAGVTTALRSLMDIRVTTPEGEHDVRGLTDWRISRAGTEPEAHYSLDEYPPFYSYGAWLRTVVETALGAGAVLPTMIGKWR
ncbi:hypothetical protein [Streptomyces sp. A012304]|uniref:hypothetical protein n=1 Tax=Streptomyces sp. A012304 TaxID=375446 RepID=UPI0022320951|nr:hypothetical protein [Streptomyces sp. A012304]GKQ36648.1 hypothetical protein ALMP_31880 [Streptomyces sp. A012304]